jgi:hypothetical protein
MVTTVAIDFNVKLHRTSQQHSETNFIGERGFNVGRKADVADYVT